MSCSCAFLVQTPRPTSTRLTRAVRPDLTALGAMHVIQHPEREARSPADGLDPQPQPQPQAQRGDGGPAAWASALPTPWYVFFGIVEPISVAAGCIYAVFFQEKCVALHVCGDGPAGRRDGGDWFMEGRRGADSANCLASHKSCARRYHAELIPVNYLLQSISNTTPAAGRGWRGGAEGGTRGTSAAARAAALTAFAKADTLGPPTRMALSQLGSCYFLIMLNSALMFFALRRFLPHAPATQERILYYLFFVLGAADCACRGKGWECGQGRGKHDGSLGSSHLLADTRPHDAFRDTHPPYHPLSATGKCDWQRRASLCICSQGMGTAPVPDVMERAPVWQHRHHAWSLLRARCMVGWPRP